jgi:hypothetical protein
VSHAQIKSAFRQIGDGTALNVSIASKVVALLRKFDEHRDNIGLILASVASYRFTICCTSTKTKPPHNAEVEGLNPFPHNYPIQALNPACALGF